MKNRLLVPSFSFLRKANCGKDDPLPTANISLEWLFHTPGTLLWADEILMSDFDYKIIHHAKPFRDEADSQCARLLFDRLHAEGIISTFDPINYLETDISEAVSQQVEEDTERWGVKEICDTGKNKTRCMIKLGDSEYCPVWVNRIYTSIFLSRVLKAPCLFDSYEIGYCRKRFLKLSPRTVTLNPEVSAFNHVFSSYVPNLSPVGPYVVCGRRTDCAKAKDCAKESLEATSKYTDEIIRLRNKEEIAQLRTVIKDLSQSIQLSTKDLLAENKLLNEFKRKVSKHQKLLDSVFPKIERWCKVAALVSVPFALVGIALSNPLVTISGASIAGIAKSLNIGVEVLSGKYKWVAFLSEESERTASKK